MKRAPIITVMGHIDHGKSTLLDYIRKTKTTESEAGGITQHICAYEASHQGQKLVFIDTPGHEAFSSLRKRGVLAADIAILVVSAEEGPKTQTLEAKTLLEKIQVPFIVAINKMDQATANLERTKKGLAEAGVWLEGAGGSVPAVAISAKTGEGVNELLDLILLLAEMQPFKEESGEGVGGGFVLETRREPRSGISATVIIQRGSLKQRDCLVSGNSLIRVRKLQNCYGETVNELKAISSATVWGWNQLPAASDPWSAFNDRLAAERALAQMATVGQTKKLAGPGGQKVDQETTSEKTISPLIIRADTQGSLEALREEIAKSQTDNQHWNVVSADVGAITENDIKLARIDPRTLIIGFKVKIDKTAQELAAHHNLTIQTFQVIYELSDWLAETAKKLSAKSVTEQISARATVLKLFNRLKGQQIIGCAVTDGQLISGRKVRLKRRGELLGEGKIVELQELKNKVTKVTKGKQCGVLIESRWLLAPKDELEILEPVK